MRNQGQGIMFGRALTTTGAEAQPQLPSSAIRRQAYHHQPEGFFRAVEELREVGRRWNGKTGQARFLIQTVIRYNTPYRHNDHFPTSKVEHNSRKQTPGQTTAF